MVRNGQPRQDGQALVPHAEDGADGLREGDVEGVEVLCSRRVVERQRAGVVVQQDAQTPHVRGRLDGELFTVVTHGPRGVAAAQDPRRRVLTHPAVFGSGFICDANGKPGGNRRASVQQASVIILQQLQLTLLRF